MNNKGIYKSVISYDNNFINTLFKIHIKTQLKKIYIYKISNSYHTIHNKFCNLKSCSAGRKINSQWLARFLGHISFENLTRHRVHKIKFSLDKSNTNPLLISFVILFPVYLFQNEHLKSIFFF